MKHLLIFSFVLIAAASGKCQQEQRSQVTRNFSVCTGSKPMQCTISFSCAVIIDNVLVLVHDSRGQTVFLENKNRFRGEYRKELDLNGLSPGDYTVQVYNDNEKLRSHIHIE